MYANKMQEKLILDSRNKKAEKEKKKTVSKQKTSSVTPQTTAKIDQQKLNYNLAAAKNDYIGKRIANTEANKVREKAGLPRYSSAAGDKQASLTNAKNLTGLKQNISNQMASNANKKVANLSANHPLNRERKTVSPIPTRTLQDMFDKNENYVDKFKKGNIKGGVASLLGETIQLPQSALMNLSNNFNSVTHGKGLQPYHRMMDYTDYENQIKNRNNVKPLSQLIGEKNKALGNVYSVGMNIASDPLNLLDVGAVQTVKGLKNLGSAKYTDNLVNGKLVPTAGTPTRKTATTIGGSTEVAKPRSTQFKDKDSYINEIVEELGARHNPRNLTTADLKIRDNEIAKELDNVANMTNSEFKEYAKQNKITSGQLPQLHKSKVPERIAVQDVKMGLGASLPQANKGLSYIDANAVPYNMRDTFNQFINSTDEGIMKFAEKSKKGELSPKANYQISAVGEREANDIKNLLGIDVNNYSHSAKTNAFQHIERRHGVKGQQDKSMEKLEDVGRIPYVLKEYDAVEPVLENNGKIKLSKEIKNSDGTYAPLINFKKRIDGHYYVVEAVPDNKAKKIQLVSAYMQKAKKEEKQMLDMPESPQRTSETPVANSSFNSILQQPKNNVNQLPTRLGKFYEKTVDSQYTIGKSVKGIDQTADKNAKILASNARNARGTVDYSIKNGLVDMQGRQVAKTPLQTVFESTPDLKAFNDYLLHKHNIDRFREEKPIFGRDVTSADSAEIAKEYERQYPQFKEFSKAISENSNKLVDEWLVKGGLISKELGEKLKLKYKNYVPTYREGIVKADGYNSKGLKANTVVKNAVGGDKPVIAPNISIGIQMQQAIKAVRKNEIYQGLLDAVRKEPQKMSNFAKLADDTANTKYQNTILKNTVDDIDLDNIENVSNKLLEVDEKMGKYYATAMENGKPVRMEISEDLFNGLKSLDAMEIGELDGMANFIRKNLTNPFKALITGYNPFFALRNIARDIPTSYIQGTENNPLKWGKNLIDAGYNMAKDTDSYKEFKALGGKQSGYFNAEKGITSEKLPTKILRKAGEAISTFNEATETLPRFGEYLGTLKREGTDYAAKQQGIYNAGEVTVNFARNGKKVKAADSVIPYLNPAVQGIDKSIRTFGNPKNVAKAIGMVSAPSAAVYMLNNRTEEDAKNYAMLDNRTKDTYFVFPIGEGKYFKIPKSREAGVLFSSLPERIYRHMKGDTNAFKGFGNTVTTNFAPQNPIEDNLLAPATLNLAKNKDFANRAIIPTAMLNDKRSPYLQYDETTSSLSKWLGSAVRKLPGMEQGVSPKVLDYLIDSYTGIIGDVLLPATTKGQNPIENVLTKPFTADTVYNNELQNTFYENFDNATRAKTDLNINKEIPTDWITPEEKKVSAYNKISQQMSDIRKQINTRKAEGASKEELRGLRERLNDLAVNGPNVAEEAYNKYKKNYVPEISGMSEKQQEGYRTYAQPQGVSAAEFNSAYKSAKDYRTDISKIATILSAYPDKGENIAKGLGYSGSSILKAKLFVNNGIDPAAFEKFRMTADTNKNGKINAKEAHDVLENENLTNEQRAYLIRMIQGKVLKEKNSKL